MKIIVFLITIFFLSIHVVVAYIDFDSDGRWGTSFVGCEEMAQPDYNYQGIDICDGLVWGGLWTIDGLKSSINVSANNPGGGGGLGARFWKGSGYDNSCSGTISVRFLSPLPELWIRWYHRYEEGFEWRGVSGIAAGTKEMYTRTQGVGSPYIGYGYGGLYRMYPGGNVVGGRSVSAEKGWFDDYFGGVSDGSWVGYEIYMRSDEENLGDGVFRIWRNGELIGEWNDLYWGSGDGWTGFHFLSNQKDPVLDRPYYVDVDDLIIYNQTPPNTDVNGNPFIGPIGWNETVDDEYVICQNKTFVGGYCCNSVWFSPSYEQYGGCPSGNYYYVSPNGTETWPYCLSVDNPCRASGVDREFLGVSSGDVVFFLNGTYDGLQQNPSLSYRYPAWWPQNSGNQDAPIIFKSLHDKGAHLIGLGEQDSAATSVIGTYLRNYTVWQGFVISAVDAVDNPIKAQIGLWDTVGSAIKSSEIIGATHYCGSSCANIDGIRIEQSKNILIENCYIHGFREEGNNENIAGIKTYRVDNVTVRNCEFFNNSGGIYFKGGEHSNLLVENNWFTHNHVALHIKPNWGNYQNVTVRNNVISNNAANVATGSGETFTNDNNMIHNNIFVGGTGWVWKRSNAGLGPSIFSNIFYNLSVHWSSHVFFTRYNSCAPLIAEDHNRLDFGSGGVVLRYYEDRTLYSSLGDWQSSGELFGGGNPGYNSITDDPLFANPSGTMSELSDFVLSNNSPCKGAGRDGVDMGADISRVGIITYYVEEDDSVSCGNSVCDDNESFITCPQDCPPTFSDFASWSYTSLFDLVGIGRSFVG